MASDHPYNLFASPSPATITDWLKAELDKVLAKLPNDQARHRCLCLQTNVWMDRMRAFHTRHEQPFNGPHPEYGYMSAGDFLILLGMLDAAKTKLERVPA